MPNVIRLLCAASILMTSLSRTSAQGSRDRPWKEMTVDGLAVKWKNLCVFEGGKQVAGPFVHKIDGRKKVIDWPWEKCSVRCATNPECTHFNVYPCTLHQSTGPLPINFKTFNVCGFIPSRTRQEQTY